MRFDTIKKLFRSLRYEIFVTESRIKEVMNKWETIISPRLNVLREKR